MDNETKEILGLILDKLGNVETRLDRIETRLDNVEIRLDNVENNQAIIVKRLDGLEKRQDEIFDVVKAIEHSNNTHKAELDNLSHRVGNTEGTMSGIGEFIQSRMA